MKVRRIFQREILERSCQIAGFWACIEKYDCRLRKRCDVPKRSSWLTVKRNRRCQRKSFTEEATVGGALTRTARSGIRDNRSDHQYYRNHPQSCPIASFSDFAASSPHVLGYEEGRACLKRRGTARKLLLCRKISETGHNGEEAISMAHLRQWLWMCRDACTVCVCVCVRWRDLHLIITLTPWCSLFRKPYRTRAIVTHSRSLVNGTSLMISLYKG